MNEQDIDNSTKMPSDASRMVKIGLAATLYLASLWLIIAIQNDVLADMHRGLRAGLLLGAAVMTIVISAVWLTTLNLISKRGEPIAPRTKRANRVMIASCVLGAVIATIFSTWGGDNLGELDLLSNGPVPVSLAIILAVLYTVGMIYGCWSWIKNSDEHERASVVVGMYGSVLAYCILAPVWWMLQRASLVPAQDPMIMYTLILTVFGAVWTYQRGT